MRFTAFNIDSPQKAFGSFISFHCLRNVYTICLNLNWKTDISCTSFSKPFTNQIAARHLAYFRFIPFVRSLSTESEYLETLNVIIVLMFFSIMTNERKDNITYSISEQKKKKNFIKQI